MWFLTLLTWLSMLIQLIFATLALAAGLYYLAELVEEYTVATAKVIRVTIIVTTGVYVGLVLFESFPWTLIAIGFISNFVYFLMLNTFPYIELSSPVFIGAVVCMLVNHYFAFSHFSIVWHPFSEVIAFFTVCLWLIPFMFFVSLSANENVLPTMADMTQPEHDDHDGDVVSSYFKRKSKKYGLLGFLKSAQDNILPQRVKKHF